MRFGCRTDIRASEGARATTAQPGRMARDRDKSEIKVTDRRLFTAEGELRPDAPEEEAREERKPEQPAPPGPPIGGPPGTIPAPAQPVTPPATHAAMGGGEAEYP